MTSAIRGVALTLLAAGLVYAVPASADIEVKAGCDGHWVAREGTGFETFKVCERDGVSIRRRSDAAISHRTHRKAAHSNAVNLRLAATRPANRRARAEDDLVLATASQRNDFECVILTCPQFLLTGVGY